MLTLCRHTTKLSKVQPTCWYNLPAGWLSTAEEDHQLPTMTPDEHSWEKPELIPKSTHKKLYFYFIIFLTVFILNVHTSFLLSYLHCYWSYLLFNLIIFLYYNKTTPFGAKIIQFSCFFIDFLLCKMVECDDAQGKCHGQRLHCVHVASCSGYQEYFRARFTFKR